MLIGLLADVHGNVLALQAALRSLAQCQVGQIWVAGDSIGYYPYVNEVVDLLRTSKVTAILGNHEAYFLGRLPISQKRWGDYQLDQVDRTLSQENRAWLAALPGEHHLEIDGFKLSMYHGSPWGVEEYIYPDSQKLAQFAQIEADAVIMGHTHIPMVHREGRVLLVNPGSCGQPRDYQPGTCFGILDTRLRKISLHRIAYDLQPLIKTLESMSYPRAIIEVLTRRHEDAGNAR